MVNVINADDKFINDIFFGSKQSLWEKTAATRAQGKRINTKKCFIIMKSVENELE